MREQVIRVLLLSHLHHFFNHYGKDVEVSEMLSAEMEAASRMSTDDLIDMEMDYLHEFGVHLSGTDNGIIGNYQVLNQELASHELYEECAALKSIRDNITDSIAY